MTERNEIREMIDGCIEDGSDYAIIVTDTFDYSLYAVGVTEEMFKEIYIKLRNTPMSMIMEVYNLSLDINEQLREKRAFNYPSWW